MRSLLTSALVVCYLFANAQNECLIKGNIDYSGTPILIFSHYDEYFIDLVKDTIRVDNEGSFEYL